MASTAGSNDAKYMRVNGAVAWVWVWWRFALMGAWSIIFECGMRNVASTAQPGKNGYLFRGKGTEF